MWTQNPWQSNLWTTRPYVLKFVWHNFCNRTFLSVPSCTHTFLCDCKIIGSQTFGLQATSMIVYLFIIICGVYQCDINNRLMPEFTRPVESYNPYLNPNDNNNSRLLDMPRLKFGTGLCAPNSVWQFLMWMQTIGSQTFVQQSYKHDCIVDVIICGFTNLWQYFTNLYFRSLELQWWEGVEAEIIFS